MGVMMEKDRLEKFYESLDIQQMDEQFISFMPHLEKRVKLILRERLTELIVSEEICYPIQYYLISYRRRWWISLLYQKNYILILHCDVDTTTVPIGFRGWHLLRLWTKFKIFIRGYKYLCYKTIYSNEGRNALILTLQQAAVKALHSELEENLEKIKKMSALTMPSNNLEEVIDLSSYSSRDYLLLELYRIGH